MSLFDFVLGLFVALISLWVCVWWAGFAEGVITVSVSLVTAIVLLVLYMAWKG